MTPYIEIYGRFLSKIRDYPLLEEMSKENGKEFVESVMHDYLISAIANFTYGSSSKLKDRDSDLKQFNQELSDVEIEILAKLMLIEYLSPIIVSSDKIEFHLSSKDFRTWSPANLIQQLRNIRDDEKNDTKLLMVQNYYRSGGQ